MAPAIEVLRSIVRAGWGVVVVGGWRVSGEQGGKARVGGVLQLNGLLRLLEKKGTQSVAGREAHCAEV